MIRTDFKLGIKKSAMIFPILSLAQISENGKIKIDSTNLIQALGEVQDVRFEIQSIQDSLSKKNLSIETALLSHLDSNTVLFKWLPNDKLKQSAVYFVTIKATALPKLPSKIKDAESIKYVQSVLEKKGRLSDSITFTINVLNMSQSGNTLNIADVIKELNKQQGSFNSTNLDTIGKDSSALAQANTTNVLNSAISPIPFELNSTNTLIKSVPNGVWSNKIFLSGASSDNSNVQFSLSGNARISSQSGTSLVVSGIAPVAGESKIEITAKRNDGRIAITSFVVSTAPLSPPQLPNSLITGENYRLNFASEGTPSEQINMEVYENDKLVISKNQGGAILNYTPQTQGKTRLVRYIGNLKADEFSIDIVALPKPIISQPKIQNDEFIITTISFGRFKGLPNKAKLIVDAGNALDPEELTDRYRFDNINQSHNQIWRVKRKDKNEDFSIHIFAIDQRGSGFKSNDMSLNGNIK